jgi:hypothetical protein
MNLFAQYAPENYMSETWAMEDMSNPYGSPSFGENKKGVYFWRPKDEWYFTSTMSRVSDENNLNGIGYVSFVSTHTSGSYHPVGVGFGENANKIPFCIDMSGSGNDSIYIEIENVSNQDINVRVGLKDINNKLIDTKANTSLTSISSGIIDMAIPKGTIRIAKFGYKNGFYAEWGDKNKCTDWANPNNKSTPCAIKGFDFTKVVGANITINSTNPQNVGLDNAEIRIRKIEFGKSTPLTSILENKESSFNVFPNPSHGMFQLENPVNWEIKNINGVLLRSGISNEINLSDQPNGLYLLKVENNIIKLMKE